MFNLPDLLIKVAAPLLKGNVVRDPATLKKVQNLLQLTAGALPLIAVFVPGAQVLIDKEVLVKLYSAVGAVSIYLTTASTDKIGI
jgi:hypothetical protein